MVGKLVGLAIGTRDRIDGCQEVVGTARITSGIRRPFLGDCHGLFSSFSSLKPTRPLPPFHPPQTGEPWETKELWRGADEGNRTLV